MNVLMVTSECAPFIKTGGLADVVGALPAALHPLGIETRVMLPAYPALFPLLPRGKEVATFKDLPGGPARLVQVKAAGITLLLLDAPQLFDRDGLPYTNAKGKDWKDNHLRFGALAKAAADVALGAVPGFRPDIVHAHDWQAALTPVYLKMSADTPPKSVITIHNIAFQGRFNRQVMRPLGLDDDWFHPEALEFHGDVGFLKGGLMFADWITTVSPTYASEILTPEFGIGLDGVLRARRGVLSGILNGIDAEIWNPESDPHLAQNYNSRTISRRGKNRAALCTKMGLDPDHDGPLFCVISRLSEQKGLDALLQAVPHLVRRGGQLAVLGTGDPELEAGFKAVAQAHPGRVAAHIGYDEPFAHLMQGGSDAILIPSRFEPCGLTQLYGLRYGVVPVVSRTGGLADTVIDANPAALDAKTATGVVFGAPSQTALETAMDRIFHLYAQRPVWQMMQRAGMRQPVSWDASAQLYADLYSQLKE